MKQPYDYDGLLDGIQKIHMIGIGGSGMCPLAEILHTRGYCVSGSDVKENEQTQRLTGLGIKVFSGQKAENVKGAQLVVYSAAVKEDNEERMEAKKLGIPQMERSMLLGALTRKYGNVIGVCGTHGKTTVTSMITQILLLNKMQPTSVIGGKLPLTGSFCTVGDSDTLVCESCEFVDSFLQFSPDITVLLNIDNDHLDYFKTMENLENSFKKFVSKSRLCYVCGDDERANRVAHSADTKTVTYGFAESNDYVASNLSKGERGYSFTVLKNKKEIAKINMSVAGKHNVLNGLASFAVCCEMGVKAEDIASAIESFTGAGRRFEILGVTKDGITVADDYAHHPTEIKATLTAAKSLNYGKVVVAFQPYTFSRVANLKDGMIEALSIADKVFLTPIVASRETNVYGVSSNDIADKIDGARVIGDYGELAKALFDSAKEGDLILTMGAGDVYKVAHIILENK